MKTLATIGVYGFTADTFVAALRAANVCLLLDVRQRRGVRGSEYSWANSLRLQARMAEVGVTYRHLPHLAPTRELRHLQYREDDRLGVSKRSRNVLADEYRTRYTAEILNVADLASVVDFLPEDCTSALLCVERDAQACHRSLIAERIKRQFGVVVTDIVP